MAAVALDRSLIRTVVVHAAYFRLIGNKHFKGYECFFAAADFQSISIFRIERFIRKLRTPPAVSV